MTIKFCIEHIIRNIIHKFSIEKENDEELSNTIKNLQSASTYEKFFQFTKKIERFDFVSGFEILAYLLKIDPRHWSAFVNRDDISDSQ